MIHSHWLLALSEAPQHHFYPLGFRFLLPVIETSSLTIIFGVFSPHSFEGFSLCLCAFASLR